MTAQPRKPRTPPAHGSCRDRLPQVLAYAEGDVNLTARRSLERHLATCNACGHLVAGLRAAIDACRAAGGCRVPADVQRLARARARVLMRNR
jgi:anti-sigma factor RsiW